jgi:hypothetical protein
MYSLSLGFCILDKARAAKQGLLSEQTLILQNIDEREADKLALNMLMTDIQYAVDDEEKQQFIAQFNKLKAKIRAKNEEKENRAQVN